MSEAELLRTIEPIWMNTALKHVASDSSPAAAIRPQLTRFFEVLVQALNGSGCTGLEAFIDDWYAVQTENGAEGKPDSLIAFLSRVMTASGEACNAGLPHEAAQSLHRSLISFFALAFEKAALRAVETRVLRETGEIERLNRSKSDFISVAAHELKTPLTLIVGYTAMLRDALGERSQTEPESTLLDGIDQGSRRLQTIIDDMIDVSLIDNRLLALHYQPVWVDRIFNRLANELAANLKERCISLELALSNAGQMIYADPERLTQAFRQVLENTVKYTPNGGKITVSSRLLPGFLEIQIADTGVGIDPADQSRIFEKFSRLGNPVLHSSGKTKFKGGGPGLGLHITRGILEAHGGTVWVESPGYDEETCPGSTFHLLLPLRSEPPDKKLSRIFECDQLTQSTNLNQTQ